MSATILCRFVDAAGNECIGQPTATDEASGLATECQLLAEQNLFGDLALGEEKRAVAKVLAPVDPKAIVCIGLNYPKHAAESGMAVPDNPVVFHKTVSTLNHPVPPPHPPAAHLGPPLSRAAGCAGRGTSSTSPRSRASPTGRSSWPSSSYVHPRSLAALS